MEPWIWFSLAPFGVIIGAGLIYIVMSSRMDVLLAEQRADLAAARAAVETQRQALDQMVTNAAEGARSRAMEEFLRDIRIEERHYTREHKALFLTRKCLVRQERIFFRNIPLSNWIEHEMPIEEGADVEKLAHTMSIFADSLLNDGPGVASGAGFNMIDGIKPVVKLLTRIH